MPDRWKYPWPEIAAYYEAGHSRRECQLQFGFSHAAWKKAIRGGRLHLTLGTDQRQWINSRGNPIYDWSVIQSRHDGGRTRRECMEEFGFSYQTWYKAVQRGELQQRRWASGRIAQARSVEDVLKWTSRSAIKRALLKRGILVNRCDECGISEWRGKPLAVQIDHRNGVRDDHRLENLRMLCPNCHSQTKTFAARNRKPKPSQISFLIIGKHDPGSSNGRTADSESAYRSSNLCPGATALSSRGLGRRPLTAVTRVRIPLGLN